MERELGAGVFPCIFIASLLEKIMNIQCHWKKIIWDTIITSENFESADLVTFQVERYAGVESNNFSCVWFNDTQLKM